MREISPRMCKQVQHGIQLVLKYAEKVSDADNME